MGLIEQALIILVAVEPGLVVASVGAVLIEVDGEVGVQKVQVANTAPAAIDMQFVSERDEVSVVQGIQCVPLVTLVLQQPLRLGIERAGAVQFGGWRMRRHARYRCVRRYRDTASVLSQHARPVGRNQGSAE